MRPHPQLASQTSLDSISSFQILGQRHGVELKINNLYLPSVVFLAQVLVGPSIKRHKEIE